MQDYIFSLSLFFPFKDKILFYHISRSVYHDRNNPNSHVKQEIELHYRVMRKFCTVKCLQRNFCFIDFNWPLFHKKLTKVLK